MCSYVIPQWFIDSGLINRPRLMQVWFALLRWSEEAASREPQTIEVAPYSFPPQAAKTQSPEPQTEQTTETAPTSALSAKPACPASLQAANMATNAAPYSFPPQATKAQSPEPQTEQTTETAPTSALSAKPACPASPQAANVATNAAPYSFSPQAGKTQSLEPQTEQTAQAAPDNRTRRFSISNLSRALGIPRSSVRRAIAQLTAFGLVASKTDTHNSFIIIKNTASYMVPPETVRPWPRPAIPAVTEKSPLKEETKERKNQRNKNKEEINLQRENPLKGACAREGTNVTCRGTNDEIDAEKNSADLTEQNSNSGLLEVLSIESLAPQDAPYFFTSQTTKAQSLELQTERTKQASTNAAPYFFSPQATKVLSIKPQDAPYFFSPQAANTPSFRLQNDKVQSFEPQDAPYFFSPQAAKALSIKQQNDKALSLEPQDAPYFFSPQAAKALSIGPQATKALSIGPQTTKALSIGPQTTKAESLELQAEQTAQAASIAAPYYSLQESAKGLSIEPQSAKGLSLEPQSAKGLSIGPQTEKTLSIGPQTNKAQSLELQTEQTKEAVPAIAPTAAPACPASPQTAQAASIAARQERFEGEVAAFEGRYSHEMLLDFAAYWTEPNRSGSKMRFEMERTWKLSLRLATWARHERMYNANKRPQSSRNQNLNYEYQRTCPDRLSYEARERLDRETRQRDAAGLMSRLAAQNRPYQG